MASEWLGRTEMLFAPESMQRLANAKVAVLGLGGVGSYAAEALARGGVGHLVLIDGDTIADSNRNRQLVALTSTIGKYKAEVMKERVLDINPDCDVTARCVYYMPGEGEALLDGCDYVADCIDMVTAKLALAETCYARKIPHISAMGCGNKLDSCGFQVADLFDTTFDPLCRIMRKELKKRNVPELKVVYSRETPQEPLKEAEGTPGRHAPGSVSFVPGIAGLTIAGEIIKTLAGICQD